LTAIRVAIPAGIAFFSLVHYAIKLIYSISGAAVTETTEP